MARGPSSRTRFVRGHADREHEEEHADELNNQLPLEIRAHGSSSSVFARVTFAVWGSRRTRDSCPTQMDATLALA